MAAAGLARSAGMPMSACKLSHRNTRLALLTHDVWRWAPGAERTLREHLVAVAPERFLAQP